MSTRQIPCIESCVGIDQSNCINHDHLKELGSRTMLWWLALSYDCVVKRKETGFKPWISVPCMISAFLLRQQNLLLQKSAWRCFYCTVTDPFAYLHSNVPGATCQLLSPAQGLVEFQGPWHFNNRPVYWQKVGFDKSWTVQECQNDKNSLQSYVKTGLLFRSATLDNLSSEDVDKFIKDHNIHTILDLRTRWPP